MDRVDGFTCQCKSGFEGSICETGRSVRKEVPMWFLIIFFNVIEKLMLALLVFLIDMFMRNNEFNLYGLN